VIDFGLSEDQEALQRAAREFLAAECPPALVRDNAAAGDGIPRALYKKMADLGWIGLAVPEAMGGLGLSTVDLTLVLEEIGRAVVPGPFLPTQLVIAALVRAGTKEQRAAWLPRFLAADAFGTLAFVEGDQALDPAGTQTTAKRTKDGWTLTGTKLFVQDAPGADVFLVPARTKAGTKTAGISLFLIERGAKGVRTKPQDGFDRWVSVRAGRITRSPSRQYVSADVVGVAAPVRDFAGRIVAAVNVSAPKFRFEDRLDEAGERVHAAAADLSRAVGFDPEAASILAPWSSRSSSPSAVGT